MLSCQLVRAKRKYIDRTVNTTVCYFVSVVTKFVEW